MADDDKTQQGSGAGAGAAAGAATSGTGNPPATTEPRSDAGEGHSNRRTAKWVEVTFRGHFSKSNQTEFIRAEGKDGVVKDHGIGDRFEIGIEKLGRLQSLGYSFDIHND